MDLKINDTKEVKALERKEISGVVNFEGATPSKEEVKKQLASQLKVGEDVVVVKLIKNIFGATKAVFNANIYNKPGIVAMYERKTRKQRREEEKATSEKAKEEKKPAAEEVKEKKPEAKEEKKEE